MSYRGSIELGDCEGVTFENCRLSNWSVVNTGPPEPENSDPGRVDDKFFWLVNAGFAFTEILRQVLQAT